MQASVSSWLNSSLSIPRLGFDNVPVYIRAVDQKSKEHHQTPALCQNKILYLP